MHQIHAETLPPVVQHAIVAQLAYIRGQVPLVVAGYSEPEAWYADIMATETDDLHRLADDLSGKALGLLENAKLGGTLDDDYPQIAWWLVLAHCIRQLWYERLGLVYQRDNWLLLPSAEVCG